MSQRPLWFVPVCLALGCASAAAQTVDYSTAEQMFGEPVTTAVTGKPQRVSDVPTDMEIITTEQIKRSGADNIPDVLRFVAGLDVRRYGQLDAAVGIRGYNTAFNPRVLVLLDGRQVYQDDYGVVVWPLIPVALRDIRQIEVIKGPSAALYGFNAVSGVINIVTFDPLRDKVNGLTIEGGTQRQAYGEAVTTLQVPGQVGVRLSAEGFRSDEFPGLPQGITTKPSTGSAAFDARVQVTPKVEWDLSGSFESLNSGFYVDIGTYIPFSKQARSIGTKVSAETPFGLLQVNAYHNENDASQTYSVPLALREGVTVIQASDVFKLGASHTVRIGAEYRDNAASGASTFSGTLRDEIGAASAMWEWQILPQLTLTNAVRVDALSLSHAGPQFLIPGVGALFRDATLVEPSFNSGLVWKATEVDTMRLTAARAVQLPSLIDFGFAVNEGPVLLAGNPGLQPSAVTNYELDYDHAFASLPATLRLAIFAQNTDTTIGSPFGSGYSFLPTGQVLLAARNFGSSHAFGGEIGLHGTSPSGLRWKASYALASVHDETPAAELATLPSVSYQRQTPTHSIIVGAGYSWDRFDLDVQARWQSRYQDFAVPTNGFIATPVTIPNYITANANLAYHINSNLTASVTAQQFNAHTIKETAGVGIDRRIFATIKADF